MTILLAVALAVVAQPTFSGAGTAGLSVSTSENALTSPTGSVNVAPIVAVRLGVAQVTPVGTVRARLNALLPLQMGSVLSGDLGSFLEFERPFLESGSWSVRFEPFNPSMRLVTFDWANATGRVFPETAGFSPVLSAGLRLGAFEGFVALRPTGRDNGKGALTAYVDALVGAKVTTGVWAIEARVTRVVWGLQPSLALQSIFEEQWGLFSASRVSVNPGGGVEAPLDLVTYAKDPTRFERFFAPLEPGAPAVAATISLEGGAGVQRLSSPTMFAMMMVRPLGFADAQARVRLGQTRLFATVRVSTLSFVQADLPGLIPGVVLDDRASSPAVAGFLGVDHTIARWKLTPGVLFRVTRAATVTRNLELGGNAPPPGLPGNRTVAVEELNQISTYPAGEPVLPRFAAKASVRWTPVDALSLVGEFEALVSPGTFTFSDSTQQISRPIGPTVVVTTKAQLFAQARF